MSWAERADGFADQMVELALTVALEQAGRTCEHPDPGGPVYQPVRGVRGVVPRRSWR